MIDLEAARATASRHPEPSGDEQELRLLVFDLCDEVERLRNNRESPRAHSEE